MTTKKMEQAAYTKRWARAPFDTHLSFQFDLFRCCYVDDTSSDGIALLGLRRIPGWLKRKFISLEETLTL